MRIIEMSGFFLGVNCQDAYFIRPDTEDEKNIIDSFVKKIRDDNPMGLDSNEDDLLTNF